MKRQSTPDCTLVALITKRGSSGRSCRVLPCEQMLVIGLGDTVADAAGQQRAQNDGFRVDRFARKGAQRLDELRDEFTVDGPGRN